MTDTPKRGPGRPRKRPSREPAYERQRAIEGLVAKRYWLLPEHVAKLVILAESQNESQSAALRRLIDEAK